MVEEDDGRIEEELGGEILNRHKIESILKGLSG
jgi:hypothetical protein